MNNEVIKVKPEWLNKYNAHLRKVDEIQVVVKELVSEGLKVTLGDIQNLVNNGRALYEQAEQAAISNAGVFTLPAAKRKFIEEHTAELQRLISESKSKLTRILALEGVNPLSIEAYELTRGVVSVSDKWLKELKESHTIRRTESRDKALELMNNVKEAVSQLNNFVADNQYFGAGVLTASDSRRSLVWIGNKGEINLDIDNLEFIN